MSLTRNIDQILASIDDLCHKGDWTSINFFVRHTDAASTETEALLAILTATACVKSKLLNHSDFVREVEAELRKRHPDSWKSMMHGLHEAN
jgi:hypothetical protein